MKLFELSTSKHPRILKKNISHSFKLLKLKVKDKNDDFLFSSLDNYDREDTDLHLNCNLKHKARARSFTSLVLVLIILLLIPSFFLFLRKFFNIYPRHLDSIL